MDREGDFPSLFLNNARARRDLTGLIAQGTGAHPFSGERDRRLNYRRAHRYGLHGHQQRSHNIRKWAIVGTASSRARMRERQRARERERERGVEGGEGEGFDFLFFLFLFCAPPAVKSTVTCRAMVSDQELANCVEALLRQAGPSAAAGATVSAVVRQLEVKLGVDLSHKADFIGAQIALIVGHQRPLKDHFALHPQPRPQFHPGAPLPAFHHHLHQIPAAAPPAVSPFTHLPHHHEMAFRYPPQPMAAAAQQHNHHHHQQLQHNLQQQQQQQQLHMEQTASVMPAPVTPRPAAPPPPKEGAPAGVKRRGGPGGLSKVCGVSPELQAIVGEPTMARTQIVKQLWAYIRKNNLQDPNNKRKIICNDELRLVFETDCTDMFKMNKLLAKHIIPLEPTKDPGPDSKKLKTAAAEVVSTTERDPDQNPVAISDALVDFFGTGEREMLQSEASRRVWDYIKANQLEDPMNPMAILCDSKLQQLFGCESLSALGIHEMLARHLFRQS